MSTPLRPRVTSRAHHQPLTGAPREPAERAKRGALGGAVGHIIGNFHFVYYRCLGYLGFYNEHMVLLYSEINIYFKVSLSWVIRQRDTCHTNEA